jgi:hypothetical protein
VTGTHLLELDQEPFYELMDERLDIARGIIKVLVQRLRARAQDLHDLQDRLGMADDSDALSGAGQPLRRI